MFCGECGAENPDTKSFCKNCGKPLRKAQQVPAPQPAAVPIPPVASQAVYYPSQPAGVQPYEVPSAAAPTSTPPGNKGMLVLGIISVIAGIAAFIFYPYLLGALAIVLGGISVFVTRKKTGKIAFIAVIGILIGIAAILTDNFYFLLFPPKEITFDLLAVLF